MFSQRPSLKTTKTFLIPIIISLLSFLFFYKIQFSIRNIPGFDGYYHIKMAEVMRTEGISRNFRWLSGMNWVDHHFFYHLLLIPFTWFDLHTGAKLSAAFFASGMVGFFYLLMRASRVPQAYLWTLFLLFSSCPFIYRMNLPRAPAVALIFLFAELYLLFRKRYLLLGLLLFFSVWLYGGGILALLIGFIAFLALFLIEGKLDLKMLASVLSGWILGLVINPFFPDNINLLFLQTTQAGLARVISGGGEWAPYDTWYFFSSSILVFLICFFSYLLFSVSKGRQRWDTVTLFIIVCVITLLFLKARRFVEYWAPFAILYSAFLFRDSWEGVNYRLRNMTAVPVVFKIAAGIMTTVMTLFLLNYQFEKSVEEIRDDKRPFERYKQCAIWLKDNTPGSTVYTANWSDFPELFFYNSKNRYVVGLDPAFMFIKDRELYSKWEKINSGKISGKKLFRFLAHEFKTPYIFTGSGNVKFTRTLRNSTFGKLEYSGVSCRVYSIRPSRD